MGRQKNTALQSQHLPTRDDYRGRTKTQRLTQPHTSNGSDDLRRKIYVACKRSLQDRSAETCTPGYADSRCFVRPSKLQRSTARVRHCR